MTSSGLRHALAAGALALTCALAGCGGDNPATAPLPEPDPLPPGTPLNDTPAHTLARFEVAYENQALGSYVALLSNDFYFEFSPQSDPALVSQFGTGFGVSNDSASTAHLFDGFTNDGGDYVPGATGITMSLTGAQVIADPDYAVFPDSAAHYKLAILPAVSILMDIAGLGGLEIAAPHDFRLVRGDAAVLRAGQPADTTHWYVRRWTDKSPSLAARRPGELAPAGVLPASAATLGRIKAEYL